MGPQRKKNHFAKSKNITTNFSEFDAIMAFIGWKAKLTSFEMPCSSRQETSFVGLDLKQPAEHKKKKQAKWWSRSKIELGSVRALIDNAAGTSKTFTSSSPVADSMVVSKSANGINVMQGNGDEAQFSSCVRARPVPFALPCFFSTVDVFRGHKH